VTTVGGQVRFDTGILGAWAIVFGGAVVSFLGAWLMIPRMAGGLGMPILGLLAVFAGPSVSMIGGRRMQRKNAALPKQEFAQPLALRRVVVIAANVPVLLANVPYLTLPMPWNVAGFVLLSLMGAVIISAFLQAYQIWVFGSTKGLDEYHLGRRRQARDLAYTGLAVATLGLFAACALFQWLPPAWAMPLIAFSYMWLVIALPCMVLAWTEPDPEAE
jgi:hypothetical protein